MRGDRTSFLFILDIYFSLRCWFESAEIDDSFLLFFLFRLAHSLTTALRKAPAASRFSGVRTLAASFLRDDVPPPQNLSIAVEVVFLFFFAALSSGEVSLLCRPTSSFLAATAAETLQSTVFSGGFFTAAAVAAAASGAAEREERETGVLIRNYFLFQVEEEAG